MASLEAAIASGTTLETCLRSRASTHASSSKSGISPAIWTGKHEGSNREIRFTPDLPARIARQNATFPMPFGLTTPIPVMTTRLDIRLQFSVLSSFRFFADLRLGLFLSSFSRISPAKNSAWDNTSNAAWPLCLRALLPQQVYLLQ